MAELEVKVPPAEFVPVEALKIDNENPNRLSPRRFEALKKSIQRYGFVVPIITNRDLLVADGEHRLRAAKALGMKQVSVVRLPVDEVDRRLIRQVMNKLRGEHANSNPPILALRFLPELGVYVAVYEARKFQKSEVKKQSG